MVREFSLMNDLGQEFSLMDIENFCLFTEPQGLGIDYNNEYTQLENIFVNIARKINQSKISGQINFAGYDNYRKFIDFIESSNSLMLKYKVPYQKPKIFYRDVEVETISKTEINSNGIISESISINCLSLWYENKVVTFQSTGSEAQNWDYEWDYKWDGNNSTDIEFINPGHIDAEIQVEIDGAVSNPSIKLYENGKLIQSVDITDTIASGYKFIYSSRENDFYIAKKKISTGEIISLFDLSKINFANDNVLIIPKNQSNRLVLNADSDITTAKVSIFVYYKAV